MRHLIFLALVSWVGGLAPVLAGEVVGRVSMPEVCSPGVSPAVVILEPADSAAPPKTSVHGSATTEAQAQNAEVVLIDQRGLQFVPRVQAIQLGRTVRFTNADSERHSVHVDPPEFDFNQSMAPGEPRDWTPNRSGIVRLACDVHAHMRGYIVVSDSPWVQVCTAEGAFRLTDVPQGRYTLKVWHEMGDPLQKELTVEGGASARLDLGTLKVTAPEYKPVAGQVAPNRPWPEVIDRISLLLAESTQLAKRPGEAKKARRLAEDSYWVEYEGSDMEVAVRKFLGFARNGGLERQFLAVASAVSKLGKGEGSTDQVEELSRKLILNLVAAASDLNSKGVPDREHVYSSQSGLREQAPVAPGSVDQRALLMDLKQGLLEAQELAAQGEADEAASLLTVVYLTRFEPIERVLYARKPLEVQSLEVLYGKLRGEVGAGLKGEALSAKVAALEDRVAEALGRMEQQPAGSFGAAFTGSLFIILREGIEVILLLTMLIALAAKTGQSAALRSIRWGVGLAVVASLLTAWGLNQLVSSAQYRTREIAEGLVMLAAAGLLFYVSYWLISQVESKRWIDFIKRQAARGAEVGGFSTLGVAAFLAVYREGAETALMYQALLGGHGRSQTGLTGILAGIGVGLVLLAVVAVLIRATSVRLPLRAFFQVSGVALFAMAVVFAGNGIFELQNAGVLKRTEVTWFGSGLPLLGIYPTVQTLSVQALLLVGAVLAFAFIVFGAEEPPASAGQRSTQIQARQEEAPPCEKCQASESLALKETEAETEPEREALGSLAQRR